MTLVRELVRQVMRDELPGVPSAHVIRLARDGRLFIEGPVAADDGRAVVRAAHLLDVVLPGFDAPPELRAPGALRLVVARALGTLDLPPYRALDQFVAALDRFAMPDAEAVVRALYSAWATAVELTQGIGSPIPAATAAVAEPLADAEVGRGTALLPDAAVAAAEDLSVSDIRRARRATGLTLGEISNRSRIPVWLLRELEWGYLRNWPAGHYGRTQLTRYARAAGLDEGVVVSTVWPMLESDATGSADVFDAPEVTVSTPPDDLPLTMVPVFAMP
ncbi:MAG TPA: helix-turn-helix domain-containing protein, partial [Vicinamibacterales bacterium]